MSNVYVMIDILVNIVHSICIAACGSRARSLPTPTQAAQIPIFTSLHTKDSSLWLLLANTISPTVLLHVLFSCHVHSACPHICMSTHLHFCPPTHLHYTTHSLCQIAAHKEWKLTR